MRLNLRTWMISSVVATSTEAESAIGIDIHAPTAPNLGVSVSNKGSKKSNWRVAEECHNSKLAEGDMFVCAQFMLGRELVMSDYTPKGGSTASAKHYTVGMRHGLTTLSIIRVTR